VAGDEKADLTWRESMVSQFFVVVEVGDDGLGRTPRIGEHKPANFFSKAFESCTFLASFSYPLRHEPRKWIEPLSKIRWDFT
tara:strand:- start:9820 stop:10065 length:246 start_codon:yes stop_codon:yes gene_type:complete